MSRTRSCGAGVSPASCPPATQCSRDGRTTIRSRRGLVLVLVLIVIAMLSLGAYAFTNLMLAHHEASIVTGRQAQSRALVDSGVTATQLFLALPEADRLDAGGLFDNPTKFRAVKVTDSESPSDRGTFSALSPSIDSDGTVNGLRNGLEDESTRLNLHVLLILDKQLAGSARTLLMGLPGMTEDVADSILDWMDTDDEPREYGCEIEYYSGLTPAYATKNGPVDTVEELLLVRGVTPQLLFGADINRNMQLDEHEMLEENSGGALTDVSSFRGWSAYLTLYSAEWNINPDGQPKVFLNSNDLNKLAEDLANVGFPEEWITFIIAYRQVGPSNNNTTRSGSVTTTDAVATGNQSGELNMELPASTPIGGILDLIGAQLQYQFQGAQTATPLTSPFVETGLASYLPQLMDYVTVNPSATIPGRININQCSSTVLAGIPGMSAEIVDKILAQRTVDATSADPARKYETWLLTEGVVTLTEMKALLPFICGGGNVYRAQVVGYFQGGQAASRAEVVFDATSPMPRVVFWRDLTHLGRGFSLDTLGVDYSQ